MILGILHKFQKTFTSVGNFPRNHQTPGLTKSCQPWRKVASSLASYENNPKTLQSRPGKHECSWGTVLALPIISSGRMHTQMIIFELCGRWLIINEKCVDASNLRIELVLKQLWFWRRMTLWCQVTKTGPVGPICWTWHSWPWCLFSQQESKVLTYSCKVLKWFSLYLKEHPQKVSIHDVLSDVLRLLFGVAQCSVLDPLVFTMSAFWQSNSAKYRKYRKWISI